MSKEKNVIEKAKEKLSQEVFNIEKRDDLSNDEKITKIIKIFSTACAAVAVQPIPFADIFVLTPIQALMGTRIAAIRGVSVSEEKASKIITEIASVVGMGLMAQQAVIGAYKVGLPGLGGFMTIPLVYGLTYAIGKVMDTYFIKKKRNQNFNPEELKKNFNEIMKQKKKEGKKIRKEIWKSKDDYKIDP